MAAKLRVCHIITKLELGGAQQNTLYTVGHLPRDQYDPTLVTGVGGMLDDEARTLTFPIYFVPSLIRSIHPLKDVLATIALYQKLREIQPHIVHTHSSKAGILGRIAAYLAGVPIIIHTFHGFGFTPTQRPLVRKAFILIEKFCALLSTHLIFVSQANQTEAEALGIGRSKSKSLIRSGIALQTPEGENLRKETAIPSEAWVITSVGNFKPQKNPLDLADIAIAVTQKDPAVHVCLLGDGPLRTAAEDRVKAHNASERIHFLGWRRDARAIVAQSDCFLLSSLWEGLPRALVEAFAAKRPAVAYAADGVRDILEDHQTGFLIPPGNTALAVEKLLWLKNHPKEATAMGAAGYARIQSEFDIDTMVRQQETLYQALYTSVPLKNYYEPLWDSHNTH